MSVLRRAFIEVEPDVSGFDEKLREKFSKTDPGGKAGKQLGGQLNRALKKLDLDAVDIKGDPKKALAAIAETERKLQALSRNASTVEIKVRSEQGLREIERFRKQLGNVGDDAGPKFAEKLSQSLAGLPMTGLISVPVIAAGVSAAPLLGAAIAGGIIGGVGIGGVIGGITLAAKDARVKTAADILGARLEGRLNLAAGAFVGPTIEGLHQIQRTVDSIDLEGLFADSAKLVGPLATGVSSAVTDIGGALRDLVANAAGPVQQIASGLALIGKKASEGLKSLADNGKEGADALKTLFEVTGSAVTVTFQLVNALTELYGISKAIGGDFALQTMLKVTGAQTDSAGFSARRTAEGVSVMGDAMIHTAASADVLKKQQEALKAVQDRVKVAQDALSASLDTLGGKNTTAARTSDGLRTAMDNLYGASIRNTDANEAFEASWDDLSASVKENKSSLDIHSAAGRANRDVLQGLLTSNNDLYLANINAGMSIDSARKKHIARTAAVKEEAHRLGLNDKATRQLIGTYGQIPPSKTTDLVLDGVREVVNALTRLYIYQRALATGRSTESVEQTLRTGNDKGPAKRGVGGFSGFRAGGRTGNIPEHEVAGVTHGKELVLNAPTVRRVDQQAPGFLDELHATGQLPGYRAGGRVAPVDTSRRWPFEADMSGTKIPSRQAVAAKVVAAPGSFGNWPSSPSAQRGDSGVWRKVVALIRSTGPLSGSFGNAYRPGDPKWHGSGRAVDWMGYNQDALATFLANRRPLELIHRTKNRDYAYTRGKNKGSFNNALMEAHRNHVHIAMANGGVIKEPVLGIGASGKSYSFGEGGRPETVTPGVGGGGDTFVFNISGPVASRQAAEDMVVDAVNSAKRKRRIK